MSFFDKLICKQSVIYFLLVSLCTGKKMIKMKICTEKKMIKEGWLVTLSIGTALIETTNPEKYKSLIL